MLVPADPIAALEARIDAIDDEIARLAEERERIERALAVMRGGGGCKRVNGVLT